MIVLNSLKEIIRVEAWSDITDRPGFTPDLDPSKHTLDSIIGRYAFADRIPCGLSNCHAPHGKGYIVSTKDGRETNIGKDCGKTYFGVDFETLTAQFDRDMTEKENRERLWNFFFQVEEVTAKVSAMRNEEHGADWVYAHTRTLLENPRRTVPAKVIRFLMPMVKTRDSRITAGREATEEEVSQQEQAMGRSLPRPHYITVLVGELAGMEALYPENNLRDLLVIHTEEKIKTLHTTNIDSLSFEELSRWSKWLGGLDAVLERAAQSVHQGRVLLTRENLAPLSTGAALDTAEDSQFQKYLRGLSE